MNGAFGLALVGQRIAEEGDDAIAQSLEHIALVTRDAHRAGILVAADDPLQDFRIHPVGQFGESHHVTEQHRELAAFTAAHPSVWTAETLEASAGVEVGWTSTLAEASGPPSPLRSARALTSPLRGPRGRPSSRRSFSVSSRNASRSTSCSAKIDAYRSRPSSRSHDDKVSMFSSSSRIDCVVAPGRTTGAL